MKREARGKWALIAGAAAPLLLLLAGCATSVPEGGFPAQKALIGKSESEILVCAVKPASEGMESSEKIVTYYRDSKANEDTFSGSKSSVIGVRHGCTAELHFKDDRVTAVEFHPSVRGGVEHCEEIFRACMP